MTIEGFALISADENIEEETFPDHVASQFYPVKIGDIFRARYQIVGKLGYGVTSTVWLARDLSGCRHVALKIYVTSNEMGEMQDVELDAYMCIENSSINHPGRRAIRLLLDSFDIDGPVARWAASVPCAFAIALWDSVYAPFSGLGDHLFIGRDPEFKTYRGRTHLAEIIALLGPPSPSLLPGANLRSKFFSDVGEFCAGISIPESKPLNQREIVLEGEDRDCFSRFMRKMLQWDPEKRSSAKELAEDEWVLKHY
ncbi:hypothetical protein E4U38_006518 [Claviceps purpurea]|nr:hypothetical protein E4U38_006518 [Claviceps purpurea]